MATALQPIYQPNTRVWAEKPQKGRKARSHVSTDLHRQLNRILAPVVVLVLCASIYVTGRMRLVEANFQKASLQRELKQLNAIRNNTEMQLATKISQKQIDQWVIENGLIAAGHDALTIGTNNIK